MSMRIRTRLIAAIRSGIGRALLAACLLGTPAAHAAQTYQIGSADDPVVRYAAFLDRDKRNLSAIVELRLLDPAADPLRMPEAYQWALADASLDFGLGAQAEQLYRNLAGISRDKRRLALAQLHTAEFLYERGQLAEARAMLYRMREGLDEDVQVQWQDHLARVLMAEGRYNEAVTVLTEPKNARDQTEYMRYNLGIALINDGRAPQGETTLDRVGRLTPQTELDLALADRANTTLGWHFLQHEQGGTSIPILSRVRLSGPFSNRALLGLGWAQLSPKGGRVAKVGVGDEQADADPFTTFSTLGVLMRSGYAQNDLFSRVGLHAFSLSKISKEDQDRLRRALVYWVELIGRDPMDTAVQEAWLAIPYSLDRLGAYTQALQFYEKAIEVLENARSRMTAASESIDQGRMVETIVRREIDSEAGWEWSLRDLPDAPETYFLQQLIADHRYQEALKNYRDIRMLSRNLETWIPRLRKAQEASLDPDQQRTETVETVIRRARANYQPSVPASGTRLKLTPRLAPPASAAPLPAAQIALALRSDGPPEYFNGPNERAQALYGRIASTREQLAVLGNEQAQLLKDLAHDELENQKRKIEQYLIEARFALARLYDRQKKGELNEEP